ncbi:uncharacterized protein TRAVEDRAFT_124765, partial [Trametes versicolor FP-101664 SS1]|uniref:uncharacterized protein n=1 Tax=Trametes versicolor (strain FP-101664) TaxID=717944 RepID=UPI0004624706
MLHATWLNNRTATRTLSGLTPYEVRFGEAPDLRDLHCFGAKVWVRKEKSAKMDSKAREGRFVRYNNTSKGYRIYWPDKRSVTGVSKVDGEQPSPSPAPSASVPSVPTKPASPMSAPHEATPPPEPTSPAHMPQTTVEDVPDEDDKLEEIAPPEPALGRGQRVRKPSAYVCHLAQGKGTADRRQTYPCGIQ